MRQICGENERNATLHTSVAHIIDDLGLSRKHKISKKFEKNYYGRTRRPIYHIMAGHIISTIVKKAVSLVAIVRADDQL